MNYAKKAIKGTSTVFFISIAAAFIGYVIRMVLSRNLTPAEYGLFFSVFTLINLLAIFKYIGLGQALVKYIPEFQVHKKFESIRSAIFSAVSISFFISLIIALILFLLSGVLAEHYFKSPLASQILQFFALIFVLLTFRDMIRFSFQGLQRMFPFSLMYLTENLLILASLLLFFYLNLKLFGAIISYVIAFILVTLIYLPWLSKITGLFKEKTKFSKKISNKMMRFGLPVTIAGIGGMIIVYVDTLILTYFRPLSEVGVYNVVVPTAMIINFIAVAISQVIFPMISELKTKKLDNQLAKGVRLIQKYSFVIFIPLALTFFAFPVMALRTLFGEAYITGATTLQILIISTVFLMVASINGHILGGLGKQKTGMKIMITGALVNLVLNFYFIPKYGIIGAALTSLVSYLLIMLLSVIMVSRYVKLKVPWFNWLKTLFAGGLFVMIIYFLQEILELNIYLEMLICLFIAGVSYLLFIWLFRVIDLKEIRQVIKNIK